MKGGIPLGMLKIWGLAEPRLPHLLHPWLHMDANSGWGYPMFCGVREGIYGVAGTDRYRAPSVFPAISHELFDQGKFKGSSVKIVYFVLHSTLMRAGCEVVLAP